MHHHKTISALAVLFSALTSFVQTSWSAQEEKPKPVTGTKVANLRAAFEINSSQPPTNIAKPLPQSPSNKPATVSLTPKIPSKPKELFSVSNTSGVPLTLSNDLLVKIFEAPFVETNTKPLSNKLTGDVAAKIDGPNDTKISHKLSFTPYQRIKGLIKPGIIACMKDYDVAGHSTLGPDYEDILVTYNLYENNIIIGNSKFDIMVSTLKKGSRK
jgi:hypothetical protein